MDLALSDVRVLDLTHAIAGPSCTKLLADFGADVLKVERPEGDLARNLGPFFHDDPHLEKSGLFLHLNTNKRSITLNLKDALGIEILKELVRGADVVVESFKPGVMERLGLGFEGLREVKPDIVMTSLSNFGQTGPYRDFLGTDLTLFAWGGPMYSNFRDANLYPLRMPGEVTQMHAGYYAAVATIIGLFGDHSRGRYIDASIFESEAASVDRRLTMQLAFQYHGYILPRSEARGQGFPCGVYPCKDGFINIWGGMQFFPLSAKMMGHPEWAEDPHWAPREAQLNQERHDEFDAIFLPWILERTKREFLETARQAGILSGAVFTIEDLVHDPHFQARNFFVEAEHPYTGRVKYAGPIVKMPESPPGIRTPAPLLGQHNEEVYCGQLGFTQHDLARLRQMGVI